MAKIYAPTKLSDNIKETPEGFLLCIGVAITRTGQLMYANGETPIEADEEGKVMMSRSDEDVFDPVTMASFEGKALTINHPDDWVNPQNWNELARGHLMNIRRGTGDDSDKLLADVLVTDATAIGMVKNGLREVSCGYDADYIQTAKGKGRQTKILGNHLALVEKGRAGQSCAIMDHDGKGTKMSKLKEQMKKLLGQTIDAATLDEDMPEKKKEDEKSKDADGMKVYDELKKMISDMGSKIDSMKPKDESSDMPKKEDKKEDAPAKDDDVNSSLENRLKALEDAVAKLLSMGSEEAQDDGEEMDEEDVESMDDDMEEMGEMTGDSFARAEILSPGIKRTKDMKAKALKAAYGTKDGKIVIDALTGGKTPTFDSAEKVNTLFVAASELLKEKRSTDLSKSKRVRDFDSAADSPRVITAEKLNEMNAKHYGSK